MRLFIQTATLFFMALCLACSADDTTNDATIKFDVRTDASADADGESDACELTTWYIDVDGDGFAHESATKRQKCPPKEEGCLTMISACERPKGFTAVLGDCDDANENVHPLAKEVCNDIDDNCDGATDDNEDHEWWLDYDGDGFGDKQFHFVTGCAGGKKYVENDLDCDDKNPKINPDSQEICNKVDDDCNGLIDEPTAHGAPTWYIDTDNDGYGVNAKTKVQCEKPEGYVDNKSDCDDNKTGVHPDALEVCNNIDDDCDGTTDEGVKKVYYQDSDGDKFGNPLVTKDACKAPKGYVDTSEDCDDKDFKVNPNAIEICNSKDDDCDLTIDGKNAKDATTFYWDKDKDGFGGSITIKSCVPVKGFSLKSGDCDDENNNIHPDALEKCNGKDDDCDGKTDESDSLEAIVWYRDADKDGFGNPSITQKACKAPKGYVSNAMDCNDANPKVSPKAQEVCDGQDTDCDGKVDEEDALDIKTWYRDLDQDGFGNPKVSKKSCKDVKGYVFDNTDCDDTQDDNNPKAKEKCDGEDNDCDGKIDESESVDAKIWYIDQDGDGHGNKALSKKSCAQPKGFVLSSDDCADTKAKVNPSAVELCNQIDDNCDGQVDEPSAKDVKTWYEDLDNDTYGSPSAKSKQSCYKPVGFVINALDCNDKDRYINPKGTEICDSKDNDCDGQVDENDAVNVKTWYKDSDGDGFGNAKFKLKSCNPVKGYVLDKTDCNDANNTAYPGGKEICDGLDNNCNKQVDEDDAINAKTWYLDADKDGFGKPSKNPLKSCNPISGYVTDQTDCNDKKAKVHPGADEVCDGLDNNCNKQVDENSAKDAKTWFVDADKDGYGNPAKPKKACKQPKGYVSSNGDCNDSDKGIHPGAPEVCDGLDNNCNGVFDENAANNVATWYLDADGDGFGNKKIFLKQCKQPKGYVLVAKGAPFDCNDFNNTANPKGTEVCDNIDNDCDGKTDEPDAKDVKTWFKDQDKDGYGDDKESVKACTQPKGRVLVSGDCNDGAKQIHPKAIEVCNSVDDDCNGKVDDQAKDAKTFYLDLDKDGYGNSAVEKKSCLASPAGYASLKGDCNDQNKNVSPGATELCDKIDNDCDGQVDEDDALDAKTWYRDADKDTFGDPKLAKKSCSIPFGYVADKTDCDDSDNDNHPKAVEVCDGVDNDCDGEKDEASAKDAKTWYADQDGDGYGTFKIVKRSCVQPKGYAMIAGDCSDTNKDVKPGAIELCDNIDNDCDGKTDEPDAIDAKTFYLDLDQDGYGNSAASVKSCLETLNGYSLKKGDCKDQDKKVNPGEKETCNSVDDDCDGKTDEDDSVDAKTWYIDADKDGYGDSDTTKMSCNKPTGYVSNKDDCDDSDNDNHPKGKEVCGDGEDNNCDGNIDEKSACPDG